MGLMIRTRLYRVYPTRAQLTKIRRIEKLCLEVYTFLIEHCRKELGSGRRLPTYFDLSALVSKHKQMKTEWKEVNAQVLQHLGYVVNSEMSKIMYRQTSPRRLLQQKQRLKSFIYPQIPHGARLYPTEGTIYLDKIGYLKTKYHRALLGIQKRVGIIIKPSGKIFAAVDCEVDEIELGTERKSKGCFALVFDNLCNLYIDRGDGIKKIESPDFPKRKYLRGYSRKKTLERWQNRAFERFWKFLRENKVHLASSVDICSDPKLKGPGGWRPQFINKIVGVLRGNILKNGGAFRFIKPEEQFEFDKPWEVSKMMLSLGREGLYEGSVSHRHN